MGRIDAFIPIQPNSNSIELSYIRTFFNWIDHGVELHFPLLDLVSMIWALHDTLSSTFLTSFVFAAAPTLTFTATVIFFRRSLHTMRKFDPPFVCGSIRNSLPFAEAHSFTAVTASGRLAQRMLRSGFSPEEPLDVAVGSVDSPSFIPPGARAFWSSCSVFTLMVVVVVVVEVEGGEHRWRENWRCGNGKEKEREERKVEHSVIEKKWR